MAQYNELLIGVGHAGQLTLRLFVVVLGDLAGFTTGNDRELARAGINHVP